MSLGRIDGIAAAGSRRGRMAVSAESHTGRKRSKPATVAGTRSAAGGRVTRVIATAPG
jgi:hypothetical protein